MRKKDLTCNIISAIALLETIFLLYNVIIKGKSLRPGLDDCLFLLPLSVVVCLGLFGEIIQYHKNGVALKIYYIVSIARYMVLPLLIYFSNGECNRYMPSPRDYRSYYVAVIIMCIELITAAYIITRTYNKILTKTQAVIESPNKYRCKYITAGGWLTLGILFAILVVRSKYVIPSTNIILFKDAADDTGVWYEAIIVNCLKAFIFAELMQYIYKAKSQKIKTIYYVLAVVFAFLNFGVYYGSNRAYIVMTLIATLAVYFYIYPDNKTITLIMLIPVGLICVVTMFVNKQFGVELSDFSATTLSVKTISNIVELYVGGPWNYASGFEATFGRWLPDFGMIIASFIQKFALSRIPGFKWLQLIENASSSVYGGDKYAWDAYQSSMGIYGNSQILSGVMEPLVMWGNVFGWFVAVAYHIWVIKMLVKCECMGKTLDDIRYRYLYVWLGVMFGMHACYSPALLLWIWSKFALFFWVIVWLNDKFVVKHRLNTE